MRAKLRIDNLFQCRILDTGTLIRKAGARPAGSFHTLALAPGFFCARLPGAFWPARKRSGSVGASRRLFSPNASWGSLARLD
jgi:hypothetical protein